MTARTMDPRLIGAAGAGFFALALIGRLAYPSEPEFVGEAGGIVAFYEGNEDALLTSNSLYLVGVALLLAFVGALCSELRRSAPAAAVVALAGGVAGASLMLAGGAADVVAALRVTEREAIDPAVATVLWDLNNVLFGLAAPMAFAALVLAVATAALRAGVLPRWLGWVSLPLGLALAVPPINYVAMIVFLFWVPAIAVGWVLQPRGASAGARSRPAGAVGAAGQL
jgi:hypothetical protein